MMKKVLNILLIIVIALSFCSCKSIKRYEDFDDNYVDKLPENAEDGLTLHAFNWTYNQIKDHLPDIAHAGFKNVLTMPVQQPKSNGSAWWAFYQPLSFSIGDKSPLGSKEDLISLCDEAEKYGICILVDAVVNHMANAGDNAKEEDGTPMVDPAVAEYEPVLYSSRNEDKDGEGVTFHHNPDAKGTGSETQVYQWGNLPDLNTANPYVQDRVLTFFKACIDAGVDGFRFDAAKHIETNKDKDYASNFWLKTLEPAKEYYKEKTGKNLYVYGEILGSPVGRTVDVYTSFMRITDDGFVSQYKNIMAKKDASLILNATLKVADPTKLIAWVESHDEYISSNNHYSENRIAKYWAALVTKKGLGGLYLARPNDSLTVGQVSSLAFADERVGIVNRYHNRFYNSASYDSAEGKIFVNEKINPDDEGSLIIYADEVEENEYVEVSFPHLTSGNYYDGFTGEKVVVSEGKAKIRFESNSVAVLTRTKDGYPNIGVSDSETVFTGDKSITLTVNNYDEAYYVINDGDKIDLDGSAEITLNDHLKDNIVQIYVWARKGNHEIEKKYHYEKIEVNNEKFNVINLDPKYLNDEYELYIWSWSPSKWSKDYEIKDGVLLVDVSELDGFLIGIFEKGYEIKDINSWDGNIIKQSFDISGDMFKQGYVDMSGF